MIVISDTNIIYSCFYKPEGVIATILKDENKKLQFIAPDYLLDEVYEHLPKIMEKNHLTKRQANAMLKEFIKNIFQDLTDEEMIMWKGIFTKICNNAEKCLQDR